MLPVPLDAACFVDRREPAPDSGPLHVIWNHRWEYDKGPDRLLAIVERALEQDIDFELSVIGQQFRHHPPEFDTLKSLLDAQPQRLRRWGTIEATDDYRRYLATGDVALSTAVHEFQGLAVLEAVAAGCVPLVPDRFAYPDAFADEFRYPSMLDDIGREADGAVAALARLASGENDRVAAGAAVGARPGLVRVDRPLRPPACVRGRPQLTASSADPSGIGRPIANWNAQLSLVT